MPAALTPTGLVIETLEEIVDGMNQDARATLGASVKTDASSLLGQLIGIVAERLALLQELTQAVNSSQDPDAATGTGLESISAITGTERDSAKKSTVVLTLTGTPTTAVLTGKVASTASTNQNFATIADGTITALTAWAPTTAYAIGDRVTNSSRAYVCTVAGTSDGSGGPTGTSAAEVDNTVTWRYMGEGTGAVDVNAESEDTGAIVALSGDITDIETPVAGWDSVINLLDATEGEDIEPDVDLRVKRENELASSGDSTVDALRAALLQLDFVVTAFVFNNPTNVTDGDGVPPKAVECLVEAPDTTGNNQSIIDTIGFGIGAGIEAHGDVAGTYTDTQGFDHAIAFSRPTTINIYVDVTLEKDPDVYPLNGDTLVEQAIVDYGDAQLPGRDVVSSALKAAIFADVPGILDVSLAEIATTPSPTAETTIVITSRQLAVHDTSRITVASSDGTP